jgi:uncharacterized SAM-binding protein YcdF (DUF218 family)
MKKSSVVVNDLFLVAGIACLLYYLGMGLAVRFGQSMLWVWPLMGVACLVRWAWWRRAWRQGKRAPVPRWLVWTVRVLAVLALAVFAWVESFVFSAAFQKAPDGLDSIVVLGARVNEDGPSGSLRERIDTAVDYLRRNPGTVAVASGGQGEDEPMSEAACIRDHLVAAGIPEDRVLIEDASTSTVENLTNSFALLDRLDRVVSVGIVTNDFHVYRAVRVGQAMSAYEVCGVPARSSVFGFIHYALREFFAVSVSFLRGNMAAA